MENMIKGQEKYEDRVQILSNKWEYKFNYGHLTGDDLNEFHKDCREFNVKSIDVILNIDDYGLI